MKRFISCCLFLRKAWSRNTLTVKPSNGQEHMLMGWAEFMQRVFGNYDAMTFSLVVALGKRCWAGLSLCSGGVLTPAKFKLRHYRTLLWLRYR